MAATVPRSRARTPQPRPRREAGSGYGRVLVPLGPGDAAAEPLVLASALADSHGAKLTAISVVEVPAELPLDAHMFDEEDAAKQLLLAAREVGESYGIAVDVRVVRGRFAGEAIVAEAEREDSELIVLRKARRRSPGRGALFGPTVDYVLEHAPCRVIVAAPRPERESRVARRAAA